MKKLFSLFFLFYCLSAFSQCENDVSNPWFENFNPEPTVNCGTDLSTLIPIVHDHCDTNVVIEYYEEFFTGTCVGTYDVFRVYRAFDDSGNGVVESQMIHVVDEIEPEFTNLTSDIITTCGDLDFSTPIVSDNCSEVSLFWEEFVIDSISSCNYSKSKIWTAIDQCGNSNSISQTITVEDNMPPIIFGEIEIELSQNTNIDTIMVESSDNCSETNITYTDLEFSGNNILRTYTSTDQCGNSSTFEQVISFIEEEEEEEEDNLVAICHREGNGSYHTIWVAPQAVQAHLNHGDYLGPCQETLIVDWRPLFPESNMQVKIVRSFDNKYIKLVRNK